MHCHASVVSRQSSHARSNGGVDVDVDRDSQQTLASDDLHRETPNPNRSRFRVDPSVHCNMTFYVRHIEIVLRVVSSVHSCHIGPSPRPSELVQTPDSRQSSSFFFFLFHWPLPRYLATSVYPRPCPLRETTEKRRAVGELEGFAPLQ